MLITRPLRTKPFPLLGPAVLLGLVACWLLLSVSSAGASGSTIRQLDTGGRWTSLELDSNGYPVVSHYDVATGELRVVHCGHTLCLTGTTANSPDATTNNVGARTSLALAPGNVPVATYYDTDMADLKFVHCGNPACTAPTVRSIDNTAPPLSNVGLYSSIRVNSSGNPVIAYYTEPYDILKLVVCNNPTCGTYVENNVDAVAITGLYNSLVLDSSGFPVISYWDQGANDLRVVHCGNATCTVGNVFATPDPTVGDLGKYTSLAVDASGYPVVSYYQETTGDLKVVHCGDPTCTASNIIATPDSSGNVGQHTSLVLDALGNPVVSYYNVTSTALRVLHCGNPTCTAGNTVNTPDADGTVGQYTSIALDGAGNPVVSYYDATDTKLNVLHCDDPACAGTSVEVGGVTQLTGANAAVPRRSLSDVAVTGRCACLLGALGGAVLRRATRQRSVNRVVEAGALAGVAGGSDRVHSHDKRVAVAVGGHALDVQYVA